MFDNAAYMRKWRKTHRLTGEPKRRANCRAYANVYRSRGKLIPGPCEMCGGKTVEMHHDDYSKPLKVRWLCRAHHLYLTATSSAIAKITRSVFK